MLGGGGVRGVAHIGALSALEEAGYEIVRAAGASAGAIAGAFAVAGLDASRLEELFEELDLTRFALSDVVGRLEDTMGISSIVRRSAAQDTDPLDWLTEILDAQGVHTFADLRVDGVDDDARRTVPVDLSDVHALDVDTDGELDLFGDGYDAMRAFLADFSFDDYVSTCR